MVWVSLALCQWMGMCIFLGVRIRSCVALVLGSTRRIEICGEAVPSSGTIVCHFKSSYGALMAWAPPVGGVPPVLFCAARSTATNRKRITTQQTLIPCRVFVFIGISFGHRNCQQYVGVSSGAKAHFVRAWFYAGGKAPTPNSIRTCTCNVRDADHAAEGMGGGKCERGLFRG